MATIDAPALFQQQQQQQQQQQDGPPRLTFRNHHLSPTQHMTKHTQIIAHISILLLATCSLFPLAIEALQTDCPRVCECKWKSGKESVLCLNANLTGLPAALDPGTQVLDLTGNEITTILPDAFNRANLLNLQKLFLAKCRLKSIERFAFRKLINLVELDLSYNVLTMIPTHAFDSTPELRELKIIGNPIQLIANDAFFNVPQLVRLELTDCRLMNIEEKAFAGLEMSLEWLKIDGNRLVDISSNTLTSLHNLHGLELARNPWNCTCSLRPLRQWMLRENIPYGIPPVCKHPPRLASKSWDKVELDDFACIPQIVAAESTVNGVEGSNVTMICVGTGSPEPKVIWTTRNRVVANISDAEQQQQQPPTTTKSRKLYISNKHRNLINLTVVNVELQDAGVFVCTAENRGGKMEASITLIVNRRPPEALSGIRILLASVVAAALLVAASMLFVFCVCTMRKRKQIRWNKQPNRTESYEKIEMSSHSDGGNHGSAHPRDSERESYLKPYVENGISVVGGRKNGTYRTVPSEDDEDHNLDEIFHNYKRGKQKTTSSNSKETSFQQPHISTKPEIGDLHIPRLIDFCDPAPDSGSSSLNGGQFEPTKSNLASPQRSSMMFYTKPNWNQQPTASGHKRKRSHEPTSSSITGESDKEQIYPDLLDISSLSFKPILHQNSISSTIENMTQSGGAFCTFPRQQRSVFQRNPSGHNIKSTVSVSDSQSLLLQNEVGVSLNSNNNSRHGSDSTDVNHSRRMSVESYYVSTPQSSCKTILTHSSTRTTKQNPSLPTSPAKEMLSATPLLDFTQLNGNIQSGIIDSMPSPSSSATTISTSAATVTNAYDYHAAQLERFLEEYRNLQQQLCKMKETCESIRMKEVPSGREHHVDASLGQSVKCADPVMYSAALSGSSAEQLMEEVSRSPRKVVLKNKSGNSRQPPDPPPYWLHRSAMLKRLQEQQQQLLLQQPSMNNPTEHGKNKDFYPKS